MSTAIPANDGAAFYCAGASYSGGMDVVVSDSARDYVATHGGVAYVRAHSHRCCSAGSLTLLDIDVSAPKDAERFSATEGNGVDVRFLAGPLGEPRELVIDTRGRLRRHLVAYWDGCAFKA
jgi:hypothetical protein